MKILNLVAAVFLTLVTVILALSTYVFFVAESYFMCAMLALTLIVGGVVTIVMWKRLASGYYD